ncbi:MAG TPA: hypothetical protein VM260_24755 [Pirellula sp.]|nr:hypothetical protein [Pirellula sp.]
MTKAFASHGLDVADKPAAMPFADHFPFSIFGVPAVTLYRPNMDSGMRWQHHSAQDDLSNVSVPELCRVISATNRVVQDLSSHARLPFSRGLALEQRAESLRIGRELFDLSPSLANKTPTR